MKTQKKTKIKKILEYLAMFEEEKEGGFSVWIPDLPGCASQGETFEEALANIKEAAELYLEDDPATIDEDDYDYKKQFAVPVKISYA
ncbi:MAG TPA: type II toxin-antitoxin system HicB family antitoxin [Patescibacteria group bacterium]|nr:type II toxin-antitoxin system HicB family antitoxin [Patescibacteria group bacterium]